MNETISATIEKLHLLKHPFYRAWMEGTLSRESLRDYAAQYYHHVDRFPRYLGAIHSNCEDSAQRRKVLENLNDEEGMAHGASHPELWLQFAEGLGLSRSEVLATRPRPAIRMVAETFFRFARASYHEGLGALYAYESQVPEIADSKIKGLKERYGIHDGRTLKFFEVHRSADVEHRNVIADLLERLPAAQKEAARVAAREAAESLWDFLSDVKGITAC